MRLFSNTMRPPALAKVQQLGNIPTQHVGPLCRSVKLKPFYALVAPADICPGHSKARLATPYKSQSSSNGMTDQGLKHENCDALDEVLCCCPYNLLLLWQPTGCLVTK